MSNDMLLGSAMQLIKDIERISFLGDKMECVKINQMAKDWLKQLDTATTNGCGRCQSESND